MKLVKQVCSLEQAKRLKELGVEQRSLFHWWWFLLGNKPEIHYKGKLKDSQFLSNVQECSAFTVAELGEMLPVALNDCILMMDGDSIGQWRLWYANPRRDEWPFTFDVSVIEETEAEARAAMLILLLETKLITAGEVNERLKEVV